MQRRAFIRNGTLFLAAAGCTSLPSLEASPCFGVASTSEWKIGLLTDMHYADKASAGTRHYRETLAKIHEASLEFERQKVNMVVELGDIIDAADTADTEKQFLQRINKEYSAIADDRHYVLGNHCVSTLNKQEFLGGIERDRSFYSFDRQGYHFVVLDACFRPDDVPYGRNNFKWNECKIASSQVEWLKSDLAKNSSPTLVFVHQRLDVENDHGAKNAAEVRGILEASGKVAAVFQGHSHQNDLKEIGGIPYVTLVAMVEGSGEANNGYSVLTLSSERPWSLEGFRKQSNRGMKK